jgi:hypothetical protein
MYQNARVLTIGVAPCTFFFLLPLMLKSHSSLRYTDRFNFIDTGQPYLRSCDIINSINYSIGHWVKEEKCDVLSDKAILQRVVATAGDRINDYKFYTPCYSNVTAHQRLRGMCYSWRPSKCRLIPVGWKEIQKVISSFGPILFVGDSLMRQFFVALTSSTMNNSRNIQFISSPVLVNAATLRPVTPYELDTCLTLRQKLRTAVLNKGAVSQHTKRLILLLNQKCPFSEIDFHGNNLTCTSLKHIDAEITSRWTSLNFSTADVLVLNMAHHWIKIVELREKNQIAGVRDLSSAIQHVYDFLVSKGFSGTLFFMNAHYGSAGCERIYNPHVGVSTDKWNMNWKTAVQGNNVWQREYATHRARHHFKFVPLVVDTIASLRPDWHPGNDKQPTDCLHWCTPGMPDLWVQLFVGALKQLRR